MTDQNNFNQNFTKGLIAVFLFILGIWVGRNVALPFLPADQTKIQVLNKLYSKDNVDFASFWETWDKLNATYLNKKDINGQKLLQGAISGLVESVGDPYTSYYDPEANKTFNNELSGVFEGVGIELGTKNSRLVVITPIEGSPAEKAGIRAGDTINLIDDKDATKFSIAEAVKQIRGKAGTKVKLTMVREGRSEPLEFEITREAITVKTVTLKVENNLAIVELNRFGDNTIDEWNKAVNEITTKGLKKMVLDLRNDPGGRLDTAVYVTGDFVPKGTVVVQQEDSNGNKTSLRTNNDPRLSDVKTVVLINKGSASASEIVSGALKDHKKATLVGEKTFGKGVVQSVTELKDGSGLHITVARWLTPNGNWIHGEGIKPDIEIALTDEDFDANRDPQLDKAKELLR